MGGRIKIIHACLTIFALTVQSVGSVVVYDSSNISGFQIIEKSDSWIIMDYSIHELEMEEFDFKGEIFSQLRLYGSFLPNAAGAPDLPSAGRFIAVPDGSKVRLEILGYITDTIRGISIAPAFEIPLDKNPGPPVRKKNPEIYNASGFYPEKPVLISDPYEIRGIEAVMLGVTPFAYYPLRNLLVVYSKITVKIFFDGGDTDYGDKKYRSRSWDPILMNVFLNSSVLPAVDYSWMLQEGITGCEYLIITPDKPEFLTWADSIKDFRTSQGILTSVIPVTQLGNTSYDLDKFFEHIYYNWSLPPSAVLLLADYDNGPDGITSSHQVHSETGRYITDNEFADVNGDHLPDIAFARITAQNEDHLATMVGKFLKYERHPPENPGYYNHPVSAMGWETSRWFQLCSEVIYGFWENGLGKQPVRENCIFYGTPGGPWSTAPNTGAVVDYFGQNGLAYIPDSTTHLTDWGGSAMRINNDLNNGAFMMQHRDHGFEMGWGEPSYTIYDIPGLYNDDPVFIFSVNCLTGKFNWESECFAEAFHRHDWGALGLIAATEESFSFVNDTYVWGLYDFMWPAFMPDYGDTSACLSILPCFANLNGKYFLEQSAWPYNTQHKKITYQLFHCHGDAFTVVYSEMPAHLNILHDSVYICNTGSFGIQADPGAMAAFSSAGEIIAVINGTGSPVQIPMPYLLPGNKIKICATLQNHYRYEKIIDIIPPDGPFVMNYTHSVNDSLGNNNGFIEAGEKVFINLCLKNAGNAPAYNVTATISQSMPGVVLADTSEFYGTLLPGQLVSKYNGFALKTDSSLADNTMISLTVKSGNGQVEWISFCDLVIHAPVPGIVGFNVADDLSNNNHVLETGEEAVLKINHVNFGGGTADMVQCHLISSANHLLIPDPDDEIVQFLPGDTASAFFRIYLDSLYLQEAFLPVYYSAEYAGNILYDTFLICVNQIPETWETGNFNKFSWEGGGDAGWILTNKDPLAGTYSAKSGFIIDEQQSVLKVDYLVAGNDSISFNFRVSSEEGWDFLKFYIDSLETGTWSGEVEENQVIFPVSSGPHEFRWVYYKDMFVSEGKDAAWLDDIIFPPCPEVYAGSDDTVCENNVITLLGRAKFFNTTEWVSDGTGYFQNPDSLTAQYFPGPEDIINGSVDLTLRNHHSYGLLEDRMTLFIGRLPETAGRPSGDTAVCQNDDPELYLTTPIPDALMYQWVMEPDTAGQITITGPSCLVTWNPSFAGESFLKVRALNGCGVGEYSEVLVINLFPAPEVTLDPFGTVSILTPPFALTGGWPEGGAYSGNGVYNDYFYPVVAGAGTHTLHYQFINEYGCEGFAEQNITVELATTLNEMKDGRVIFTPNPSSGRFLLDLSGLPVKSGTLEIFNNVMNRVYISTVGKLFEKPEVDLSGLPAGMYLYMIHAPGFITTGKLIIR
ncbi:MAG: T9SS type A sorting domain-containing protein [Bacteroidales bacterium]|nr:T9SS type A sorting domain-containing protein [Bacteroidales bacterium]